MNIAPAIYARSTPAKLAVGPAVVSAPCPDKNIRHSIHRYLRNAVLGCVKSIGLAIRQVFYQGMNLLEDLFFVMRPVLVIVK